MGTGASVPQNSTKTNARNSSKSGKTKGKNGTTKSSSGTKKTTGTASTNKSRKPAAVVSFDPIEAKISSTASDRGTGPVSSRFHTKYVLQL